jgi:NTP pyrophosphatase (non-canonical NTP hydrolase)
MNDTKTSLQGLRDRAQKFADDRDWSKYHQLKDLAMNASCEAAELAELFLWKTNTEITESMRTDSAYRQKVLDELGDILLTVLVLANNIEGCDLTTVFFQKMAKTEAKYPVAECYGKNAKR